MKKSKNEEYNTRMKEKTKERSKKKKKKKREAAPLRDAVVTPDDHIMSASRRAQKKLCGLLTLLTAKS